MVWSPSVFATIRRHWESLRHEHRWSEPVHYPRLTIQHCEDFCGAHQATLHPSMLSNECSGGFRCSMGLGGAHEMAASREKYEEWVRKEEKFRASKAWFKEIIESDIDWSSTGQQPGDGT